VAVTARLGIEEAHPYLLLLSTWCGTRVGRLELPVIIASLAVSLFVVKEVACSKKESYRRESVCMCMCVVCVCFVCVHYAMCLCAASYLTCWLACSVFQG